VTRLLNLIYWTWFTEPELREIEPELAEPELQEIEPDLGEPELQEI